MSPRTLKPTTLLTRAEEMLAEADAAHGATEDKKAEFEKTQQAAKKIINQLRDRILACESTGDIARDIKIVAQRSLEKDVTYFNINWLYNELHLHPNELIGMLGHGGLRVLGVLPEHPSMEYGGSRTIFIQLARGCGGYLREVTENPNLSFSYDSLTYELFSTPFNRTSLAYRETILVGDKAVQQWLEKNDKKPRDMVDTWLNSRVLGRELQPTAAMVQQYMAQRENCLPKLVELLNTYLTLKQKFSHYRDHFSTFAKGDIRYSFTPTEDGVQLHFSIVDEIEKAKAELNKQLDYALNTLLMADNEIVKKACTALSRTIE